MVLLKKQGAKRSAFLPVSVPSHCSLMNPATAALKEQIAPAFIGPPTRPDFTKCQRRCGDNGRRIAGPKFTCAMGKSSALGGYRSQDGGNGRWPIYECGPGKVLCGLGRRIVPDAEHIALADSAALREHWGNLSG